MADKKNPNEDIPGRETPTGTQIRVESDASQKSRNIWPWVLGLLIVGLLAWPFFSRKPAEQAAIPPAPAPQAGTAGTATTTQAKVGPGLTYQGRTFAAQGAAQSFASTDMVAVGKSDGGSTIYQSKGGGGGAGSPGTYYVKTPSGSYQPLAPVTP